MLLVPYWKIILHRASIQVHCFEFFYHFNPNFSVHCDLLNATICSVTETNENVSVGVYNTGGIKFNSVMTLPLHDPKEISISENIPFDLIPISKVKERVRGNRGKANYELLFLPELQDGFHSSLTSEFCGQSFGPCPKSCSWPPISDTPNILKIVKAIFVD